MGFDSTNSASWSSASLAFSARASGDVVEDLRHRNRFRHGLVVEIEALLGGLVVVGRDEERRVATDVFCGFREMNGLARRVRAGAADDRQSLLCVLHDEGHHLR